MTTYCVVRQTSPRGAEATASLQSRLAQLKGRLLHTMADSVFVELDDGALEQLRSLWFK